MGLSGGGGAPPPPDPMQEAHAQIMVQRALAGMQDERERAARARAEEEEAAARQAFQSNLGSLYEDAFGRVSNDINNRGIAGVNAETFRPQIESELNRIRTSIPDLDPNPGAYFGDDIADVILGRERDTRRSAFSNQIDEIAPFNFAQSSIPNTADDAILAAILDDRFGSASQIVQNAFDRGNLNQTGFQTAQDLLNSQRSAGDARLTEIGDAILGADRDRLRDTTEQFRDRAANFELGQTFDPTQLRSSIDSLREEQTGSLEGRIRSALGGEKLFDTSQILTQAGGSQGAFNPATGRPDASGPGSLLASLTERNKERDKSRGVGTQGVF